MLEFSGRSCALLHLHSKPHRWTKPLLAVKQRWGRDSQPRTVQLKQAFTSVRVANFISKLERPSLFLFGFFKPAWLLVARITRSQLVDKAWLGSTVFWGSKIWKKCWQELSIIDSFYFYLLTFYCRKDGQSANVHQCWYHSILIVFSE